MNMFNPYSTTYGSLYNVNKIVKELEKYTITADGPLNYNYIVDDVELIFITGMNQLEKELPIFEHPIVFKTPKNKIAVATDLRKYLNKVVEKPDTLDLVVKDRAGFDFIIARTLTTADFIKENFGNYRVHYGIIQSTFAYILNCVIDKTIVGLSIPEQMDVHIAAAYHANLLMTLAETEEELEELEDMFIARIQNTKFATPLVAKSVATVVSSLPDHSKTIDGLVKNIKSVLPKEKADLITTTSLVNSLSSLWFGPGAGETVIIATEHLPTWIALCYISYGDKTYKRTRLSMLLDKVSTNFKSKDFVDKLYLYYKTKNLDTVSSTPDF